MAGFESPRCRMTGGSSCASDQRRRRDRPAGRGPVRGRRQRGGASRALVRARRAVRVALGPRAGARQGALPLRGQGQAGSGEHRAPDRRLRLSARAVETLAPPDDEEDDADEPSAATGGAPLPTPAAAPRSRRCLGVAAGACLAGAAILVVAGGTVGLSGLTPPRGRSRRSPSRTVCPRSRCRRSRSWCCRSPT